MPAADILILGAGPVGCTLALALEGSAHRVRVVDPQAGCEILTAQAPKAIAEVEALMRDAPR